VKQGGATKQNLLFLALGRRGAIPRLALQLAAACTGREDLSFTFVVSSGSELIEHFAFLGEELLPVDTIQKSSPTTALRNYFRAERRIIERLALDRPDAVINLCPHVWSPILMARIRKLRIPFVTVVHDAVGHPGDPGALLTPWFRTEARRAIAIVTLSRSVATTLAGYRGIAPERIVPLFLPDLVHEAPVRVAKASPSGGFRLLHFGRLLRYKGLDLLLDALEIVARSATKVALTVAGAGVISASTRSRLAGLEATVVNRWISDAEIGPLFNRHDALVVSHLECSQSGTAAAAFGSGLPVVAVPKGGLAEQVIDGKTGVVASAPTADALAAAIHRIAGDPKLHAAICANLVASKPNRSTRLFLDTLLAIKPWDLSGHSTDAA
jgi:glycosyltransferase involved in cell wall biosynthesis